MKTIDVKFPILCITPEGLLVWIGERERLERCSWAGFHRGWFNGLEIIDSKGAKYTIRNAAPVDHIGTLWSILGPITNPELKFALELEPLGMLTLEELRHRVCREMKKHPHPWDSIADVDFEDISRKVGSAQSITALIDIFSEPKPHPID